MSDVQLLPTDKLAWHEERIRIPLPLADVYARLSNAPLEDLLPGTDTFPAVVATEPVNDIPCGLDAVPDGPSEVLDTLMRRAR
jgi:hypothetical protein